MKGEIITPTIARAAISHFSKSGKLFDAPSVVVMSNSKHTQRQLATTRRSYMARARSGCQRLVAIRTLADAAIKTVDASFQERPQHAAVSASVAIREIAAQLPTDILKDSLKCKK